MRKGRPKKQAVKKGRTKEPVMIPEYFSRKSAVNKGKCYPKPKKETHSVAYRMLSFCWFVFNTFCPRQQAQNLSQCPEVDHC